MKVEIKTLGALAVASAAPALACEEGMVSTQPSGPVTMMVSQEVGMRSFSQETVVSAVDNVFESSISVDEWTPKLERQFHKLAAKEALSEISVDEQRRLEKLSKIRQHLLFPRTPEEVMAGLRQEEILRSLTQALEKYVRFREAADFKTHKSKKSD